MSEFTTQILNYNDRILINDIETDTDKYVLSQVNSISDTVAQNLEENRPTDVGIIDYGVKMGKGEFTLPVMLCAKDLGKMHKLIQDVKQAFHPDLLEADTTYGSATDFDGYHPMLFDEDVDGVIKNFMIYLKSMEIPAIPSDDLQGLVREAKIRLKAEDPRKYNQTESTLTGAGTASNEGTVPTPVEITITASGTTSTSLTITNSTTSEAIHITTALTTGQILILNTRNHTARLSGSDKRSYIGNTSDWFLLNPGDNTLAISNGTNATVEFSWHSAYAL